MAVFHFFGEIQSVPQPPLPIEMPGRSDYIKVSTEREMNKQDEDLDLLSQSVKKLGVMSSNISTELDYQNRKLDEINAETDRAQENLDIITKKTRELIKEAG
ncbi:unnamed protein product [Aphanomyces euteiches]